MRRGGGNKASCAGLGAGVRAVPRARDPRSRLDPGNRIERTETHDQAETS